MAKQNLYYISYNRDNLSSVREINQCITNPLARSGIVEFKPDSEIFRLHMHPVTGKGVCAHISPVNEKGEIGYNIFYSPKFERDKFHKRNAEIYLEMIDNNEDIFVVFINQYSQRKKDNKEEFPNKNERDSLKRLLSRYIEANQDPYPKVACLTSDHTLSSRTLDLFLSISQDIANLSEIRPKEISYTPDSQVRSPVMIF